MPLKKELIKFILENSSDYKENYLKKTDIEMLVIYKVEIELKLDRNKKPNKRLN